MLHFIQSHLLQVIIEGILQACLDKVGLSVVLETFLVKSGLEVLQG